MAIYKQSELFFEKQKASIPEATPVSNKVAQAKVQTLNLLMLSTVN